jgi:hypothetical protein
MLHKSVPKILFFDMYKFELELYILVGRKVCICGLAEVLSLQITKRLCPQIANPQSATFVEVLQSNKIFKSANLRISDLWNLFADRPPLENIIIVLDCLL